MYDDSDRDYEDAAAKKERPTQHTKLTTKLQAEDPVVSLEQPDSLAAAVIRGPKRVAMRLWTPSGCVPDLSADTTSAWYLHFRVVGGLVAPRICIDVSVPGSRPRNGHVKRLEFFPGLDQVQDFRYVLKQNNAASEVLGENYWHVSFRTSSGISTGLDIVNLDQDQAVKSGLRALIDLEVEQVKKLPSASRLVFLSIRNPENAVDAHKLQTFLSTLTDPEVYTEPPWHPYLHIVGSTSVDHMSLQDRKIVQARSGGHLTRYPATNAFANSREASVILRYATLLEYRAAPHHGLRGAWQDRGDEDVWIRQMLSGLDKLFGSSNGRHRAWMPYFLNQKAGTNSQAVASSSGQSLDRHIGRAFPWSLDQLEAIDQIHKCTSRVKIVEGAPGSGRSTLLAAVAVTYALRGTAIALMAPCSASSKALAATTYELLGHLPTSLRQRINFLSHHDGAAARSVRQESLAKIDILVTTPNVVCARAYRIGFGSFSDNIMILQDDANLLMEPEIISTIFGLDNVAKVTDLIMVTDTYQWRPSVTEVAGSSKCVNKDHNHTQYTYGWYWSLYEAIQEGNTELCKKIRVGIEKNQAWEKKSKRNCVMRYSGGTNEFADQLALSLPVRLLRQGFPSLQLITQHRMGEELVAMPRERVYENNIAAASPMPIDPEVAQFRNLLREWLGDECPNDAATIFLEAGDKNNSACIKERNITDSKRNHRYVDVVYDLLLENHKANAINKSKIKIVTPYGDQQRLYEEVFRVRHKTHGKPAHRAFPAVVSLDSMRNSEAAIIIYDLTVTCGDKSHGIGIVGDEMRTNIALTRASDILIVVGSKELTDTFPGFWNFWCGERGHKHEPLPYIVEFAVKMKEQGLYFTPEVKTPLPYVSFDVNPAWHKEFDSHLDWEYDRNHMADQGDREDDMD